VWLLAGPYIGGMLAVLASAGHESMLASLRSATTVTATPAALARAPVVLRDSADLEAASAVAAASARRNKRNKNTARL
jgi:hypothetical protein